MVSINKIILHVNFFAITILTGCDKKTNTITAEILNNEISKNSIADDRYCFKKISDSLSKMAKINSSHYFVVSKNQILQNKEWKDKLDLKDINRFYDTTSFHEAYILKNDKNSFLILIGQSDGATGIGVDYWNYECYNVSGPSNAKIKFASISKTPFSIFFSNNDIINYITIDDNYPRPASNEQIKLDYYPVFATLYSGEKNIIKSIEYKCQNND